MFLKNKNPEIFELLEKEISESYFILVSNYNS